MAKEKNPAEYLGQTEGPPAPREVPTSGKAFTFPRPKMPEGYKFFTKEQQEQGLPEQEGYTREVPKDWVMATIRQLNKPNQAYFAQDPKRLARYYNFIRSAPQDWQPPNWMDANRIVEGYNFMKDYQGDDWASWGELEPDDPASIFLTSIPEPPRPLWMPNEIDPKGDLVRSISGQPTEPEEEPLFVGEQESEYDKLMTMLYPDGGGETSPFMKEGAWENLEPWQRFALSFFSTQPMEGRP